MATLLYALVERHYPGSPPRAKPLARPRVTRLCHGRNRRRAQAVKEPPTKLMAVRQEQERSAARAAET